MGVDVKLSPNAGEVSPRNIDFDLLHDVTYDCILTAPAFPISGTPCPCCFPKAKNFLCKARGAWPSMCRRTMKLCAKTYGPS